MALEKIKSGGNLVLERQIDPEKTGHEIGHTHTTLANSSKKLSNDLAAMNIRAGHY
jgi:hypothetical protein